MWMNLHALPAGKAMFTIAVTTAPVDTPLEERYIEEYDLVYNESGSIGSMITYAMGRPDWPYGPDARVVGVADQSNGYVLWENWEGWSE